MTCQLREWTRPIQLGSLFYLGVPVPVLVLGLKIWSKFRPLVFSDSFERPLTRMKTEGWQNDADGQIQGLTASKFLPQ